MRPRDFLKDFFGGGGGVIVVEEVGRPDSARTDQSLTNTRHKRSNLSSISLTWPERWIAVRNQNVG